MAAKPYIDIVGGGMDLISGDYDVIGQDDDIAELLAAASGEIPANLRNSVAEQALARGAAVVRYGGPTKAREYPLGFDSGALVAAGATAIVNSQPQVAFRTERLVIPSDIAGSFVVNDLLVGKNSQFANNTPVPARVFDEGAFGVRLKGDTAQVTMNVTLNVTNTSGAAIRFRACIIGTAVE